MRTKHKQFLASHNKETKGGKRLAKRGQQSLILLTLEGWELVIHPLCSNNIDYTKGKINIMDYFCRRLTDLGSSYNLIRVQGSY